MIRIITQDKELDMNYANYDIECKGAQIMAIPNYGEDTDDSEFEIARYKDHNRAMKVMRQFRTNIAGRGDKAVVIYEMPKE